MLNKNVYRYTSSEMILHHCPFKSANNAFLNAQGLFCINIMYSCNNVLLNETPSSLFSSKDMKIAGIREV